MPKVIMKNRNKYIITMDKLNQLEHRVKKLKRAVRQNQLMIDWLKKVLKQLKVVTLFNFI